MRMNRSEFLSDFRIVDLSMGWAGPLATRHLADMGAEVIKIESCTRFDWFRGWEASQDWIDENQAEKHPPFLAMNRNKKDVTLDLSTERGRDLLLRLVAVSDAVVENFPSTVLPKLNLGYEVFRGVKPEIVMLSMPGFGSTGPWKDYRAYGSTTEQAAGLPHLSGRPEWPPAMVHVALGDAVAGLNGAAALLVALRHLKRTGEGQFVDLSHAECLFPLGAHGIVEQALTGAPPPRIGNKSRHCAPHGVYPCKDGWVVIQAENEEHWQGVQASVGLHVLGAFGDVQDRLARSDELDALVTNWTSNQLADDAMLDLQCNGTPAAIVRQSKHLLRDRHLNARGAWEFREHKFIGRIPHVVSPYRINGDPLVLGWPAPTLGKDNKKILGDLLGIGKRALQVLERDGIIGRRPRLRKAPANEATHR